MKATHNGSCQVCGSAQAVSRGVIARHGYRLEWRHEVGACPGSGHPPLESSREYADGLAAILSQEAEVHAMLAGEYEASRAAPPLVPSGKRIPRAGGGYRDEMIPSSQATEEQVRRGTYRAIERERRDETIKRRYAKTLLERADIIHGRPLIPRPAPTTR